MLFAVPSGPVLANHSCPAGWGEVHYADGKADCDPPKGTTLIQQQNPQGSSGAAPAKTATPPIPKQAPRTGGGAFQLQIASKNPDCLKIGNCTLDDIVATGASFANLLTTLSGALFLVAFIYGGFMYLISFGDSTKVTTGKTAMKTASIGMIIVLGAYTIVNYVVSSITGKP